MSTAFIDDQRAIEIFQEFLRFRTVSAEGPVNGHYTLAVNYLQNLFTQHGIPSVIKEYVAGKPILIATVQGTQPELPSILLNSHYDVVPVMLEHWHYDPFAAVINDQNEIVARGTQDMKCVCIQYVVSLLRLLSQGHKFTRTLHLSFVPDEEISGRDGMAKLLQDQEYFNSLNVGVALDEGIASETDKFTVFFGERAIWWLKVRSTGVTGHASRLPEHTAMEKLITAINHFLAFRQTQVDALHGRCSHGHHHNSAADSSSASQEQGGCSHAQAKKLGDVVSLNLTMLQGGVSVDGGKSWSLNVIPSQAEAGFDLRIPTHIDLTEFENECVKKWCSEDGVSYEFIQRTPAHHVTSIDKEKNPWWKLFSESLAQLGYEVEPETFPAATDSRFLRALNIPAFGFSPMRREKILLHDHDERIKVSTYLEGLSVYEKLIPIMASASADVKFPL